MIVTSPGALAKKRWRSWHMLECALPGESAIRTQWHVAVRSALSKRMKCRDVVEGTMACWAMTDGRIETAAGDRSRGWCAPPVIEEADSGPADPRTPPPPRPAMERPSARPLLTTTRRRIPTTKSPTKAAHGFFTRTSWCSYPSAPASGCARTGPVSVLRCAPTRLLLVLRARATRSYSCARYLVFARRREPSVTTRAARAARAPPATIRAGEGSLRTDDQREDARQGRGRPETCACFLRCASALGSASISTRAPRQAAGCEALSWPPRRGSFAASEATSVPAKGKAIVKKSASGWPTGRRRISDRADATHRHRSRFRRRTARARASDCHPLGTKVNCLSWWALTCPERLIKDVS